MAKKKPSPVEKKLSEFAANAAMTAAQALATAELLGVKTKPIELLPLNESDRAAVAGGRFDSEDFDPKLATKEMKKGLPDWRSMR